MLYTFIMFLNACLTFSQVRTIVSEKIWPFLKLYKPTLCYLHPLCQIFQLNAWDSYLRNSHTTSINLLKPDIISYNFMIIRTECRKLNRHWKRKSRGWEQHSPLLWRLLMWLRKNSLGYVVKDIFLTYGFIFTLKSGIMTKNSESFLPPS